MNNPASIWKPAVAWRVGEACARALYPTARPNGARALVDLETPDGLCVEAKAARTNGRFCFFDDQIAFLAARPPKVVAAIYEAPVPLAMWNFRDVARAVRLLIVVSGAFVARLARPEGAGAVAVSAGRLVAAALVAGAVAEVRRDVHLRSRSGLRVRVPVLPILRLP